MQTVPQVPQLLLSFCVLISQPSTALLLQFAKPGAQESTWQVPPVHAGVSWLVEQTKPQLPQLFTSVWLLTSHPSTALLLQFKYPGLHVSVQVPETQAGEEFCPLGQASPQLPQFCGSVCRFLQNPPHKVWPAGHAAWQIPPTQEPDWQSVPCVQP